MKPFPWKCAICQQRALEPASLDYNVELEHDSCVYQIAIADLQVLRCGSCGNVVLDDSANERVSAALREAAGLLQPEDIHAGREKLGLTQRQLAALIGVPEPILARWESGGQIQQRVMDRFLRCVFALPEVRNFLSTPAA